MHSGPSRQTRQPSSPSRRQSRSNSTSSNQSQRQSFPQSESTRTPPPMTALPAQQDIIESSPPAATGRQLTELHGKENLQDLPPDTLKNKYGKFQVQRGITAGPEPFGHSYSTDIEMDPKMLTHGSEIDFVQVVRSSNDGNWKTTAQDHGWKGATDESGKPLDSEGNPKFLHRAELTEQETGTGWRVDQSMKFTPFHQESLVDNKADADAGRHHFRGENERARLEDRPAIAGPGYRFDAMSTAMDKKSGKEFGTVEWGYEVEQNAGESTIKDRTPSFLKDNLKLRGPEGEEARERDRGRRAAYKRWNQVAPGQEQADSQEVDRLKQLGVENVREPRKVTRIPNID